MTTDKSYSEHKIKEIVNHCNSYRGSDYNVAFFQLSTTLALYLVSIVLMFISLSYSYALTLILALPTAGLLTRLFIFQHDCGHGSFLPTKRLNDWTGRFLSLFTIIPYDYWRRSHNIHHATSGNLDHRNVGGIDTITVREYLSFSPLKKVLYRFYRNPIVMIIFGTPAYILFVMRFPHTEKSFFYDGGKALHISSFWKSVILTDISILLCYGAIAYFLTVSTILSLFLPIFIVTSWIGGWLFYVQHQFEDTYWHANEDWNFQEASLHGSTYYELPPLFQWLSGNIGFHHIHHLCSKIPNYKLQKCMEDLPELKNLNRVTFIQSLACLKLTLWDEENKKLISFREIKA